MTVNHTKNTGNKNPDLLWRIGPTVGPRKKIRDKNWLFLGSYGAAFGPNKKTGDKNWNFMRNHRWCGVHKQNDKTAPFITLSHALEWLLCGYAGLHGCAFILLCRIPVPIQQYWHWHWHWHWQWRSHNTDSNVVIVEDYDRHTTIYPCGIEIRTTIVTPISAIVGSDRRRSPWLTESVQRKSHFF